MVDKPTKRWYNITYRQLRKVVMQTYQVNFVHGIQRNSSGGCQGQTSNQGTMTVQANSNYQAQQQVQNMFGGYNNCEVRTVVQK